MLHLRWADDPDQIALTFIEHPDGMFQPKPAGEPLAQAMLTWDVTVDSL